jgi:hypothetical protein
MLSTRYPSDERVRRSRGADNVAMHEAEPGGTGNGTEAFA